MEVALRLNVSGPFPIEEFVTLPKRKGDADRFLKALRPL